MNVCYLEIESLAFAECSLQGWWHAEVCGKLERISVAEANELLSKRGWRVAEGKLTKLSNGVPLAHWLVPSPANPEEFNDFYV